MSSSPIQIKNSLSHELALTLFTRPEEAKQAFEEQKTRIKPAHRADGSDISIILKNTIRLLLLMH